MNICGSTTGYVIIIISGQDTLLTCDAVRRGVVQLTQKALGNSISEAPCLCHSQVLCSLPWISAFEWHKNHSMSETEHKIDALMDLRACLPNKCCLINWNTSKPTLVTHSTTYVMMYTDSRDIWWPFFRIHPRTQVEIRDSSCHFPPFPQCIMVSVDTDSLSCTVNTVDMHDRVTILILRDWIVFDYNMAHT